MADLIRRETIEKGLDPRDFVVFTYGGAGASHAGVYASELGVSTVVVPLTDTASVWSALGVASSDVIHIHQRDDILAAPFDGERLRASRDALRGETLAEFDSEGFPEDRVALRWTADIRHRLQVHVVEVPFPEGDFSDADLEALIGAFTERYEDLYGKGTAFTAAGVEIVTLRCAGSAIVRKPTLSRRPPGPAEPSEQARVAAREIYWPEYGRLQETPIYRAEHLVAGNAISGPAVIEPTVTTIVVRPGQDAHMDQFGNIIIKLDDSGRQ